MSQDRIDLTGVPQAALVRVFFCEDPQCLRPHVILFDERERPIAQFVLPDMRPDGGSFLQDLQHAALHCAMLRDDP